MEITMRARKETEKELGEKNVKAPQVSSAL
jgi:hypothetical protein